MVTIKWLAHAAFLLESDGLRIITDPYDPKDVNVPAITDSADIVIRSSDNDVAHAHIDTIPTGFDLVTATDIVEQGAIAKGLKINAIWSQESLIHKEIPRDNAMYQFTLEGIRFTHLGDIGNPLSESQLAALKGTDVLFALAGGPPTIELDELHKLILETKPKIVIPMHYRIPGPKFFMLPVTDFTNYFDKDQVHWLEGSSIMLSKDSLPNKTQINVLKPTYFNEE